ncbi:MAG: hypothetical protein M1556_02865 [Candidatus Thermoplasmatota archaeon]|nr:hypothetical protein [Candidatus Thermoplasmatota archaeon]MCL6002568.1 hypothetical protein [Candidatus Thermoplasmatota archaeon]
MERIVIEKQLMGLKKREHETLLVDVSLGHIHDIIVDKNLLTKSHIVKVVTQQGTYSLKVHDPYHWQERITAARKEISGSPNNSMSQPTIIINAGPQGAQQAIQKETIERQVIKIRCRYCGTLVDEVIGTCPSCGAKL